MATVLGSKINGRKVVTTSGTELGVLVDAYFEEGGTITSVLVKPLKMTPEIQQRLTKDKLLEIPYRDVRAFGKYVLVDFPA